jgi:hypothetical protein
MPLRFVLPSAASPNIVVMKRSNPSAGRTSQTKLAGVSPTLRKLCTVPASTVTTCRGHLAPPAAELERALENLEALALEGVDVGRGHAAARLHGALDLDELAARLGRRATEVDRLAGDGVHERVAGTDGAGAGGHRSLLSGVAAASTLSDRRSRSHGGNSTMRTG